MSRSRTSRSWRLALGLATPLALPPTAGSADTGVVVGGRGQPVCQNRGDLAGFVLGEPRANCLIVRPGTRLTVIEEYEGTSSFGHAVRIRVVLPNGAELFGYTVSRGLEQR